MIPIGENASLYTIAVVIPAYNAQEFISGTLDSVAKQSRFPEQIIIVDDGSKDQTVKQIKEWEQRNQRDVSLFQQENRGVSAARNTGIRAANTDLIAFLDADDLYLPDHLALLEQGFRTFSDIVLCFADAEVASAGQVTVPSFLTDKHVEILPYKEYGNKLRVLLGAVYGSLISGSYIPMSATLVRKRSIEQIGFFDENLVVSEDRDLWLRLSRKGSFAYYPLPIVRLQKHSSNLTHPSQVLAYQRQQLKLLHKMKSLAGPLGLSAEERQTTQKVTQHHGWEMLYTASRRGVRTYFDTCRYLLSSGVLRPVCNLKHLIRAIESNYVGPNSLC